MPRKTRDEIEKVKSEYGVDRLWSWSRVHTYQTSKWEYMLKYVQHVDEDRTDCIYATMGGLAHDIIEKMYNGTMSYDDMESAFDDGWAIEREISNLKFDRNDEMHDKQIADKYYMDLKQFFKNHVPIKHKVALERFVVTKIGDNVLQGYIDCCFKDDDGCFNIIDWKTSSIYLGKKAEGECGQLVVYALALHQMGVPFDKIKIAWNFLKYCTVSYVQKNGKVKTRNVERCKLAESLKSNVIVRLRGEGLDKEEIDRYISDFSDLNDMSALPESVRNAYEISDCYVYVPLTQELVKRWYDEIESTIDDIVKRETEYDKTHDESLFWDSDEDVKAQSYYFSTLCGYSAKLHKPYKHYLDSIGVTDSPLSFDSDGHSASREVGNVTEDDLSWLESIL